MENIPEKTYNIFQNTGYLIRESWGYNKRIVLFSLIAVAAGTAAPIISVCLPKAAVDLLVEQADAFRIAAVLGGLVGTLLILQGAEGYFSSSRYYFYNNMRKYFMNKLFFRVLDTDYQMTESEVYQKVYNRALETVTWGDNSGPSRLFRIVPELLKSILCFFAYAGILSTLHPGVVALLLANALIIYFCQQKEAACYEQTMEEYAHSGRHHRYISRTCEDVKTGKDIRVYDMAGWLTGLIWLFLGRQKSVVDRRRRQEYVTQLVGAVLNLLRDGLAYAYLITQTLQGNIGLGDFMLYFGSIAAFSDWVIQIIWHAGSLKKGNIQMNYLRTFLDIPYEDEAHRTKQIPEPTDGVDIEFDHVSFRYPGSDTDTIHDVSFHIKKGERVAIVGNNGAGKTTLVKLMTGLYEPTSGTIRLGGKNITTLSKKDIFSLYSAVFQDILILPFRLDENIAMKRQADIDESRVREALRLSGLTEELAERNITEASYMTKQVTEKGVNLSGGQQQRLLLARALYKNAPILVLDEPTAALDPVAEKEMYERYKELYGTAIFISHRLASTQFSDRIFHMKNGRMIECGSHEELLRADGEYAHMFEVQSYYYNMKEEEGAAYGG